jgi:hypothetical protein
MPMQHESVHDFHQCRGVLAFDGNQGGRGPGFVLGKNL